MFFFINLGGKIFLRLFYVLILQNFRGKSNIVVRFSFLSREIILWSELPWPENAANTYARDMETLDGYFDQIRSHQQCIPWSPPLEIEPATIDCRAKTLQLSHESISHTSGAKLTSHGNCAANWPKCVLQVTSVLFTEDTVTSRATSSQED